MKTKNVWMCLIFCLVIFGLIGVVDAQLFTEAIGGPGHDFGRSVAQTSGGSFVITGPWRYSGDSYSDILLTQVNGSGNHIASKILKGPGNNFDTGNAVIEARSTVSTGNIVQDNDGTNDDNNDCHYEGDPAQDVNLGDDYTGSISYFGSNNVDFDCVKFSAGAGAILKVTLKVESGKQCYLALWDASHNYLAIKTGTEFQIDYPLTEEGDYYLGVSNWWLPPSDYPIDYTLEIRTSDFVVVGHSNSFGSMNAIIANLSSGGDLRWAKILSPPGSATSHGLSLIETSDHGFVMTGAMWDHPDGTGMDLFIVKFNSDGSYQWGKILDGGGDDCGSSVIEVSGGFMMTGWTTSFGTMDVLLARFNSDGSLDWAKAYGGTGNECGDSIIYFEDFFVVGTTDSFGAGNDDVLLIRFDGNGNPVWSKTLGGPNDDHGHSLTWTWCGGSHKPPDPPDGAGDEFGIAITGDTESFGHGGKDLLVAMFGLDGTYIWARTLNPAVPGISDDVGLSIINDCYQLDLHERVPQVPPGFIIPMNCKLAVTGVTSSWGTGGQDVLFATMDYYGYTACEEIAAAVSGDASLSQTGNTGDFTTADIGDTDSISFNVQSIDPAVTPICTTNFGQFTDIGPVDQPVLFKFAIIADNHINKPELEKVVGWINEAINDGEDIRFVMVLGDISDEGYRCRSEPYIKVKNVLDQLKVPYMPIIGNHDEWYDYGADEGEDWFEKPQEEIFHQIFSPEYDYLGNIVLPGWTKAPTPVKNYPPDGPATGVWSYFENFAFDYMRYHFICLDSNSRNDIYTSDASDWNRGFPDLHQGVTGGTWEWFEDHLGNYPNMGDENILLFAHHPLSFKAAKTDVIFKHLNTFDDGQYSDIVSLLGSYGDHVDKWLAGHWHVCDGLWLCCEENITDDVSNNVGSPILRNIETRSVTPYPVPPGENIRLVRVHGNLYVNFDAPSQAMVSTAVSFTDLSWTTAPWIITNWDWDFGDGTHYTNIQNPTYRYTKPGIYKATLTVTTNTGLTGSISKAIDVGTTQLTSDYPDATAYNNARRLIYDNGILHLIYRWSPADWEAGLTYAKSTDQCRTWFEVTRSTLTGGDYPMGPLMGLYPALDVGTLGKPYTAKVRSFGLADEFDAARREKTLGWFSYDRASESGSFGSPSVVVDSEGTLHIAISISYHDGTSSEIRYYKGHPGGLIRIDNTLDYEVVASDGSGECQFASIALNNSEVPNIIWQQGSSIYHSYHQGPHAWSAHVQISSSSANARTPSLDADGSILHAVWQEDNKVVYKKYDGGWPTTTPTTVSTLSPGTIESYPQVVSRDGLTCVVWADIAGGNYEIFYSWTDTGSWSSPPENLSGTTAKSQYPQAAICSVSPNELCVVWTEGNSYDIRSTYFSFTKTATGTGTAHLITDSGIIQNLKAVPEAALPSEGKPNLQFPDGFFSFNITGLTLGQSVNVTIILPEDKPTTTQYWKCHTPEGWYQIPMGSNDGDNIITIQLTDGGTGDDDGVANGIIDDQGGPGTLLKVKETEYKNSITQPIDISKIRFVQNAVNEKWVKGSKWPIPMELMYWQKSTKYLIEIDIDGNGNVTRVGFRRWGNPITEIPYKLAEQSLASLPPGFAML